MKLRSASNLKKVTHGGEHMFWDTTPYSSTPQHKKCKLKQLKGNTEAGMLLGISQKHNVCSRPCRLTELCNSQCLSHFAAPFIVIRTETSIVEKCKLSIYVSCNKMKHYILFAISCSNETEHIVSRHVHLKAHGYFNEENQIMFPK